MIQYKDFAILCLSIYLSFVIDILPPTVRFNALSRAVETSLQKGLIPNRFLGGQRFFERMEVDSEKVTLSPN
jgi:DNA helicase-2/ATP-dependent DNA helicase PcrA